jgi:hypothetical protein
MTSHFGVFPSDGHFSGVQPKFEPPARAVLAIKKSGSEVRTGVI